MENGKIINLMKFKILPIAGDASFRTFYRLIINKTSKIIVVAKKEKYHYGLIAQNVLAEFPECTFEKPDGYLGIDYMGLTSVLILKMQKQNKILKEKDEKIENLENTVKKQEIILDNIIQRMEKKQCK